MFDQAPSFVSSFRLSRPSCLAQTLSVDYARSSINSTNDREKIFLFLFVNVLWSEQMREKEAVLSLSSRWLYHLFL